MNRVSVFHQSFLILSYPRLQRRQESQKNSSFWSGSGKLESIVRSWQTRLCRLFKLAIIQDGHAHRFRDTFAVELLLAGVPIERVSVLLGHQSVRITEKRYAPWVRARQEQLEADLARSWSRDPLVLSQGEVHERYMAADDLVTQPVPMGNDGARGGGRTHTTRKRQGFLVPLNRHGQFHI